MNPNSIDLLIQTIATVLGGIILFLLGLAYSAFSKRTKEYMGWLSKTWRPIISLILFIYITFYVFSLTKSVFIAALPLLFAFAIYLLIVFMNNSIEIKAAKVFELQMNSIAQLRSDSFLAEIYYWELRDVPENVLSYCYMALSRAPSNYHNYCSLLNIIENTIEKIHKSKRNISTFRFNELHELLPNVPKEYAAQANRILISIDSLG